MAELFHVGQLVQFKGTELNIMAIDGDNEMAVVGTGYWEEFGKLTPLEPRPGDRVRVVALSPKSALRGCVEPGFEGIVTRWDGKNSEGYDRVGLGERNWGAAHVILLRRAATPAGEAKGEKWEPKRGERIAGKHAHSTLDYSGVFLGFNGAGHAQVTSDQDRLCRDLLRESILPISPPPVGSAPVSAGPVQAKPAGGGSSKVDPYAKVRENEEKFAAATLARDVVRTMVPRGIKPDNAHDLRVAATRRAHLDQARAELDRKVERRHPSDWPGWDEPTNVLCNGRP